MKSQFHSPQANKREWLAAPLNLESLFKKGITSWDSVGYSSIYY